MTDVPASVDSLVAMYFDGEDRMTCWPSRKFTVIRRKALERLALSFEEGIPYSQYEVDETLQARHIFNDALTIRREMVEAGLLVKSADQTYQRGEFQIL